eukprot:149699_1
MAQQLEGTSNSGENELNEFTEYLTSKGVSNITIQKLIQNELTTIALLRAIEHDLDEVCKECGINVIQKVKLRKAMNDLNSNKIIIDTQETKAMLQMESKLKSLQNSIITIDDTKQKIDKEIANHTEIIQSTFTEFHELLNQREALLIEKLAHIGRDKKNKLQNLSTTTAQQSITSEKTLNSCRKKLNKSIEFDEIETRKKDILKIAEEFDNIKVVTKEDPEINDNKINLKLDKKLMVKTISSFGDVTEHNAYFNENKNDNGTPELAEAKDEIKEKPNELY